MLNFTHLSKNDALTDIVEAFRNYHLFTTLGWQDVATRYRRSRVGAFWLTINMVVMITVLGTVFGALFRAPVEQFLPSLTIGIIVWGLMTGLINEGCVGFISAQDTILQVRMPLFTHLLRVIWRNLIITGHNIMILPILFIILHRTIQMTAFLSLLGLLLLIVNAGWMMLISSIICTRFRDLTQIIQNAMQVLFYATPIIWSVEMLQQRIALVFLNFNPFYHLLSIVRDPLLGVMPSSLSWLVASLMALVGWIIALTFFNRFRKRIAYWL